MKTEHTTETERARYEAAHANFMPHRAGNHGIEIVDTFCQLIRPCGGHIIELGAGDGRASKALTQKGLTVSAVDIARNAPCHALAIVTPGMGSYVHNVWEVWPAPLKGEWHFSADFMEHLPEDKVDEVFKRFKENVREGGIMKICTVLDATEQYHLTVKPAGWWTSKATNYYRYVRVLNEMEGHVTLFMRNDLGN